MKTVSALLLALTLAACKDKGECLKSHIEIIYQPQYITVCSNNTCTSQFTGISMYPVDECDQWQYPNGKPEGVK